MRKVLICSFTNLAIYVYPITTVTQFNIQQSTNRTGTN